jgi:integrase
LAHARGLAAGPDGKRRQRWLTAPTKKALEALVADTTVAKNTSTLVETPAKLLVRDWLAQWLDFIKPAVAPATYANYESAVWVRWTPTIGHSPLIRLGPAEIEGALSSWLAARLHSAAVENHRDTLAVALKAAVRLRKLPSAPIIGVRAIKRRKPRVKAWSAEGTRAFLSATAGSNDHALWLVALTTGLRQKSAGAPELDIHGARCTHATLLLAAGAPLHVVQARLGHRAPKMLLAHYAAVTAQMEGQAADAIERALRMAR